MPARKTMPALKTRPSQPETGTTLPDMSATLPVLAEPEPMHPGRVPRFRLDATEAGWHNLCSEPRCVSAGRCSGPLRRIGLGPRCYPSCARMVLGAVLDPENATPLEQELVSAMMGFDDEEQDEALNDAQLSIVVLDHLSRPGRIPR